MNRLLAETIWQKFRAGQTMIFTGLALCVLNAPALGAVAASSAGLGRMQLFTSAAQEFGVPKEVLLAVSYNQSRWTHHDGVSADNGYGLTDLRTKIAVNPEDGRGDPARPLPQQTTVQASHYTLDEAAYLLHVSPDKLKTDDAQNLRGAAVVLASYARQQNGGQLPHSLNDWYAPVAEFSGATSAESASSFADDVFATMQSGAALMTGDGQNLKLDSTANLKPNRDTVSKLGLGGKVMPLNRQNSSDVDCPSTLNCRFIPAGYAQNSSNPADYGNYDNADRPNDMKIKYIYIHDTEGSYQSAINHFQDTTAQVSGHYIIRSSDGDITQMVRTADVAWTIGNWYDNMHSVNIEHEGIAADGATWYTPQMYKASATLVRYLAHRYNVPLDRQHILGHDQIPRPSGATMAGAHWDPGPFWDWGYYMSLLHGQTPDTNNLTTNRLQPGDVVKIAPNFATNQQPLTDCGPNGAGPCVPLPPQGSNIIYLHTQPSADSPLVSNPYLHPGGEPGTIRDDDWSATANSGDEFVVADKQGDWTGIWFSGQVAWFFNPSGANHTAKKTSSKVVTPKAGLASIPVYAGAYPNSSEFPAVIPDRSLSPIYTIPAGQHYTVGDTHLPTDYYYDETINYSLPLDHTIVHGSTRYYQIMFNHRIGLVKADDVSLGY